MARNTPQLRWKIAQAIIMSGAGALDPLPVEEVIQASLIASIAAETACDPIQCQIDLEFGQLYEPYLPACIGGITAEGCAHLIEGTPDDAVLAALRTAINAQWMVAMTELAILKTVHRRHTAHEFGDEETFRHQDAHREALIARVKEAQRDAIAAWDQLLAAFEACSSCKPGVISADRQQAYLKGLDERGFGPLEKKLLRAAGVHPIDIHWSARALMLADVEVKDVPFTDLIDGISRTNTFEDIYKCSCEEAVAA